MKLTDEERKTLLDAKSLLMNGAPVNEGTHHFIDYLLGFSGSFYTGLFELYIHADHTNKSKLRSAFPDEFRAYDAYNNDPLFLDNLVSILKCE